MLQCLSHISPTWQICSISDKRWFFWKPIEAQQKHKQSKLSTNLFILKPKKHYPAFQLRCQVLVRYTSNLPNRNKKSLFGKVNFMLWNFLNTCAVCNNRPYLYYNQGIDFLGGYGEYRGWCLGLHEFLKNKRRQVIFTQINEDAARY